MGKKCSRCGIEKPMGDFCKSKRSRDGLRSCCRECNKKIAKEWRMANPDKVAIYNKAHRAQQAEWRRNNIERTRKANREWDHRNRKRETERKKAYFLKRYCSDPLFKYKISCRNTVHRAVCRRKPYNSTTEMFNLLGCSFETLQEHLLRTWEERYGAKYTGEKFNIDHIIPLSVAKDEKKVKELCYYTNLQMLTPEDNRAKADKMFF